ncbi:Sterol 3-beta-glucosyltransferase UGT80B1 [Paramyrothecium foliicola]|nr:Sterol 3-beta-glucosyltransferase UGT80B1 [Paramyrothecium foliicola]
MASSEANTTDAESIRDVTVETTFRDDQDGTKQRASVLKTPEGQVAYPAFVPPSVESPETPAAAPQPPLPDERSAERKPRDAERPLPEESHTGETRHARRPSSQKRWQTELPRRGHGHRPTLPSVPKRAGTSYLDTAIKLGYSNNDQYSDSSSSSDEDEAGPTEEGSRLDARAARPKREKGSPKPGGQDRFNRFRVANENYETKGKVKRDGRLRITVNETANTGYIAKALGGAVSRLKPPKPGVEGTKRQQHVTDAAAHPADISPRPRLNIVIMVIGSRGDAQPFLKIGKVLKEDYGHRVRIATHPAFRDFVEKDSGLEFFSVGGDPSELMAFMVKNPGMIPTLETVKAGDIGRRRAAMAEMFDGFWRACINATDDEKDSQNLKMMGAKAPFVADAIIANPPSFAHIHCAEALGIPLHLMFTFPYTPTQAFPHPLASIKRSNVDPGYTNFISYPLVEMMVWQGLGDLVNDFRVKTLALDPISTLWAPGATYRLHVPFTYLWSPGIVPKPADWGDEVDVAGFVFLDLASSFKPPQDLQDFLDAGDMPIYIGFGSIVVDDADRFTEMIFEAVKLAGVRALVSKGWGGLGGDDVPDNIFMLDNTPHDWLFPRVKACVIHGGAGTTAIALKCGKPTMIVPFFGDQHFWGSMVSRANAGPEPIPYKQLNAEKLAEGIKYCLTQEAKDAVGSIAKSIEEEGDGAVNAVRAFHNHLNLKGPDKMRCGILPDRIAAWKVKDTGIQLSPLAADILMDMGHLNGKKLRLLRHMEWNDFEGPGEPVTGIAGSVARSVGNAFKGVGSVPYRMAKHAKRRKRHDEKQRSKSKSIAKTGSTVTGNSNTSNNRPMHSRSRQDSESLETASTVNDPAEEILDDVANGVEETATAIAKAPADLSLALAQGFHNAPRLYGDDTVRRPPRVTGYRSGLRAARKEFMYGIYDGWTGVVRLPIREGKKAGVPGAIKGTGMGLMGFVLKNTSAIIGPWGYTLRGVVKQIERSRHPEKFVRRARIVQGQRESRKLQSEERKRIRHDVVEGWNVLTELREEISNAEHRRGIAGQLDKVFLDTSILFQDVETARQALQALQAGKTPEELVKLGKDNRKSHDLRRSSDREPKSPARESTDGPKSPPRRSLDIGDGGIEQRLEDASSDAGEKELKSAQHDTQLRRTQTALAAM